ncbi:site-specific integrase [Leptolyngbya sp. AN02str]|uniref:site-specific integrase n=1 Tax=Leptolyngbya sp. AN02str TaxID=3423363 RepID=UPI003D322647
MTNFDARLAQSNGRLKAARVGLRIENVRDRLYLRGTFPPKPGATKTEPFQQRLALGYRANPAGLKLAEFEARKVGVLLQSGEFDWGMYVKKSRTPQNCADWVERFEQDYFSKRDRTDKTLTTWRGDYLKVLRKLPPDEPLTVDLMQRLIMSTSPNTKTRKRFCMVLGMLSKLAGVDFDPTPYAGNYSPSRVQPRDLPGDREILEWYHKLENPAWRWVYGMMAAYGLRNHEVFRLDFDQLRQGNPVIQVEANTKTGARRVWCCYPEWFDEFHLHRVQLPNISLDRPNERIGNSVTDYFRERSLPFKPYDLRHCWAIRTLEFGLPVELAAQQMGHSLQVHCDTYHHWISDRHHQRAWEIVMMRNERPKPPKLVD